MKVDVVIIGAGAAGLMCAIEAGKRGRRVLVLDHANKVGKKILMSGGGRCNFTNEQISPARFISHNPHFSKSALSRYTQWDFIALIQKHQIAYHHKTLGQLFCDNTAKDIVAMLLKEAEWAGVNIRLNTPVLTLEKHDEHAFKIKTAEGTIDCESVVVATGGLSIPTMGASPFGYKIAEQFGIKVWPTRAGLVPVTLHVEDKERLATLSGIASTSKVSNDRIEFNESILFTHRGLSGPSILQISSYWQPGEDLHIQLLPELDLQAYLKQAKLDYPKRSVSTVLSELLPKRLLEVFLTADELAATLANLNDKTLSAIADRFQTWVIKPNGTEGYRTAEVTLGGVDCDAVSSKTMEATAVPGLFFIGEVLDVTGWLGGYNFQWAWSSGWAAGQVV